MGVPVNARAGMTCPSREARYVPWSFGEVYECVVCKLRVRQPHTTGPLDGKTANYDSPYPMPEHEQRVLDEAVRGAE